MKKHEKEIERVLLEHEKEVLDNLKKTYERALSDIQKHTKQLHEQINRLVEADIENKSIIQSKIYQLNYQNALKEQISGYLDVLKSEHVKSIEDYMKVMYEDSYLTNIYNLQKYGIPVTVPINQELMIKSLTYDINKIPLSKRLYDNVDDVKKKVVAEISRGISTGMSYADIARNLKFVIDVSNRKANMIAQNEGHRIKTDARIDSMRAAKKKGADIVKVWDATLDNKTRPVHQELDQKRAEIEEKFKFSGGEVFAPKQFGIPALDINCRCVLISVPRWDLEDTIQKRDNINGELIEAKNYADWKKKYYNLTDKENDLPVDFDSLEKYLLEKYNIKMDKSVKELDFTSLNNAIKGVESVIDEYPELGEYINNLITSKSGIMSCTGKEITFNQGYFKDGNSLNEILERNSKKGWFPPNTTVSSIGVHEAAHGVEWVLIELNKSYEYLWQKVSAWNNCEEAKRIVSQAVKNIKKTAYGKGKRKGILIESISEYANKNSSETMAEAFNDVYANKENANPLSIEIKRLTMETYKKYKER